MNQKDPAMAKERNKFETPSGFNPFAGSPSRFARESLAPTGGSGLPQPSLSKSAWSRNDDVVEVMELDVEEDVDMALK